MLEDSKMNSKWIIEVQNSKLFPSQLFLKLKGFPLKCSMNFHQTDKWKMIRLKAFQIKGVNLSQKGLKESLRPENRMSWNTEAMGAGK